MSGSIACSVSARALEETNAASAKNSINNTCSTFTSSNSQTATDVPLSNAATCPPTHPEAAFEVGFHPKKFFGQA
jgi:hypothetical protein